VVGWFAAEEWLAYTVNVERDGPYAFQGRVGSAFAGRTFHVEVDGTDVTGSIDVPQVPDWGQYRTLSAGGVSLRAGLHQVRVVMGPLDFMDLDWIGFVPVAAPLPGRIEAEDYDVGGPGIGYSDTTAGNLGGAYRGDDVDIKPSGEGGYVVGWFAAGEWLAYAVDVERDGPYTFQARLGSALAGRTFHVEVDGIDVTGSIAAPQFPDWDQYGTVSVAGIPLQAGLHQVRVVMGPLDFMDLEWIAFVGSATESTSQLRPR
jgi:hypothetical protein